MSAPVKRATVADLARIEGRAEIIEGQIVHLPMFPLRTARIVGEIVGNLLSFKEEAIVGTATLAYVVPRLPSGRESFCPCASYYSGVLPANPMGFIEGPPTFAVEILDDEEDWGQKRIDYFLAGAQVVWDVDPIAETVTSYKNTQPPRVFRRGDIADAEPAVPGWRIAVDEIFN